jgi:hypothetical protein
VFQRGAPLTAFAAPVEPLTLSRSSQHGFDDFAVHVGEAAFRAVVVEREPLVIEAQQVQDGGNAGAEERAGGSPVGAGSEKGVAGREQRGPRGQHGGAKAEQPQS